MPWNDKYWDTLDQVYWTPDYVGLKPLKTVYDPASGSSTCIEIRCAVRELAIHARNTVEGYGRSPSSS